MDSILLKTLSDQYNKKKKRNIWEDSKYKYISELENDDVGKVGEFTIENWCKNASIDCDINGIKTKEHGGGIGDGTIKSKSVEIKTARLGSDLKSFQHELGEKPWLAEYMIFLDIAPNIIYITIFKNFSEEHYKNSGRDNKIKCNPTFPTKSVCWRKLKGAFKLDTSISINEKNCIHGYPSFKINETTSLDSFREFINKVIN